MAEGLMTDTCTITKAGSGAPEFNSATGKYDDPDRVSVYGPDIAPHFGKCRIPRRAGVLTTGDSTSGEVAWKVGEWPFDLPVDGTAEIVPGMVVDYLTSQFDESLAGRKFTLSDPSRQSQATVRRFKMQEVVGS